jgi:uncharacterized protein (UPF0128 family)
MDGKIDQIAAITNSAKTTVMAMNAKEPLAVIVASIHAFGVTVALFMQKNLSRQEPSGRGVKLPPGRIF